MASYLIELECLAFIFTTCLVVSLQDRWLIWNLELRIDTVTRYSSAHLLSMEFLSRYTADFKISETRCRTLLPELVSRTRLGLPLQALQDYEAIS